MRLLFTPALIAAFLAVPFAAQAQTKLDPTAQALLGGMAHAGNVSALALSPVNSATTPYGANDAQSPQTYAGNGKTGFGGILGQGSLSVSRDTTAGTLTFGFNPAPGDTFNSGDVVVYLDTKAGGLADTSTLSDDADGGRQAISGYRSNNTDNGGGPSRTQVNFAPGFNPDYAISFENTSFNGIFALTSGGSGSLTYITGQSPATSGADSVTVNYTDLGLTSDQSFKFVGTLISDTAYRSDEAIGSIDAIVNPGFNDSITFSNYDTFPPSPEPSSIVPLLIGTSALGGLIIKRRRVASLPKSN